MTGGLLGALVSVIILALVLGLVYWAITAIGLPDPFGKVARVALIALFVLGVIAVFFTGWRVPLRL